MNSQPADEPTIAVRRADEPNLEILRGMSGHERQTFVPLLTPVEMQHGEVSIPDLLDRVRGRAPDVRARLGAQHPPRLPLTPSRGTRAGATAP